MNYVRKIVTPLLMLAMMMNVRADVFAKPARSIKVEGYTVKSVSDFDSYGAKITVFTHDKSGATVELIENDDPNKCFMLEFDTRAYDNKGIPHVFEHSVTNGSKKYPSRSLAMALYNRSYLTFGNASTGDKFTCYPIASLSEEQLLKFADYYTDLCFEPLILENEDIFKTEAVRYTLDSADAEIKVNGTIYSEQSGKYSASRMAVRKAFELVKPGCPASFESGGLPSDMLKLSYSEVKDFHEKFYHPSNCTAYLYGDIKDADAFLKLLDGYFNVYDKRDYASASDDTGSSGGFKEKKYDYPAAKGSPADGKTAMVYALDLGKLSDEELCDLYALRAYCDMDTSVVKLRLKSLYPAAAFSVKVDTDSAGSVFFIGADNMNENDSKLFKDAVDSILSDLSVRGLSKNELAAFRKNMETENALLREGSNIGVSMLMSAASMHASGVDEKFYPKMIDSFGDMVWFDNELLKSVVSDHLTDPERSAMSVVVPRPGLAEKNAKELEDSLAKKKASMSDDGIKKLIEDTKRIADTATDDPTEYLDEINVVKVSQLPDVISRYTVNDRTDKNNTRRIGVYTKNDRLNSTTLFLDASGLPQEDICYLSLYADLVNGRFVPAGSVSRGELPNAINSVMANGEDISFTVSCAGDDYVPYIKVSFMSEPGKDKEAFDLIFAQLFESDFSDAGQLLEGITAVRNTIRNNVNNHPESLMRYLALAPDGEGAAYYEYTHYIEYYDFLGDLAKKIEKDPRAVSDKLSEVSAYVNNLSGAVLGYATARAPEKEYLKCANDFIKRMDHNRRQTESYEFTTYRYPLAVMIDRQMVFNGIGMGNVEKGGIKKDSPANDLALSVISDSYIKPEARDRYGAYGYSYKYDHPTEVVFTANDPNTKETMDIFTGIGEAWKKSPVRTDQNTLDDYIITMHSKQSVGSGEIADAMTLINELVEGEKPDHRSGWLKELAGIRTKDMEKLDRAMESFAGEGNIVTIGSGEIISKNKEAYAQVIRPFD